MSNYETLLGVITMFPICISKLPSMLQFQDVLLSIVSIFIKSVSSLQVHGSCLALSRPCCLLEFTLN